jgi:hypothetical protein
VELLDSDGRGGRKKMAENGGSTHMTDEFDGCAFDKIGHGKEVLGVLKPKSHIVRR